MAGADAKAPEGGTKEPDAMTDQERNCQICGHDWPEHVCDTAPLLCRRDCDECKRLGEPRDFEKDAPDGTRYRRPAPRKARARGRGSSGPDPVTGWSVSPWINRAKANTLPPSAHGARAYVR